MKLNTANWERSDISLTVQDTTPRNALAGESGCRAHGRGVVRKETARIKEAAQRKQSSRAEYR